MRIHILGICGTFMGSLALLARQLGHEVSGSDQHVYPPMSTQLAEAGIALHAGYEPAHLTHEPDLVIIGNALSRGNPAVEYVLNRGIRYTSGPQWLSESVLQDRWVIALSGTHGKTTTTAMVAWILASTGLKPGYLIGGVPKNFQQSAELGESPFFVIEADEYDTAFFDKRSKFVHYRPRTAVINNLEFDHADIFADLGAIQRQFHHFVRTVPGQGLLIAPLGVTAIDQVVSMGCWTPVQHFGVDKGGHWQARLLEQDGSRFDVLKEGAIVGQVHWGQVGLHSVQNGLAALAASHHAGVPVAEAIHALNTFAGVKRRMEVLACVGGVTLYDDFAHHPTAIATTLDGLRARVGLQRIRAVIEPRSNTMRLGSHQSRLPTAVGQADEVIWFQPAGLDWALTDVVEASPVPAQILGTVNEVVQALLATAQPGDHIVLMSNGGFGGLREALQTALRAFQSEEPASHSG